MHGPYPDFRPHHRITREAAARLNDLAAAVTEATRTDSGVVDATGIHTDPPQIYPIVRIVAVTDPDGTLLYAYSWQAVGYLTVTDYELPMVYDFNSFRGGPDFNSPAYERSNNARVPVDGSAIVVIEPGPDGAWIFHWSDTDVFAILGAEGDPGVYAWVEAYPVPGGAFTAITGGRSGTTTDNAAYEMNTRTGLTGANVILHRGSCTGYPQAVAEVVTEAAGDPDFIHQVQAVRVLRAAGGTFTLTFDDADVGDTPNPQTTTAIAFDANAAAIETAIEALSNVTDVDVTGTGTEGDPFLVTFNDAYIDYGQMAVDSSLLTGDQEWVFTQGPVADGITVGEDDDDPLYPGTTELVFDQGDGFVVSQPSAGRVKVKFTPPVPGGVATVVVTDVQCVEATDGSHDTWITKEAIPGIAWEGAWVTATGYTERELVSRNGSSYIATADHTSGATTEPGVGVDWATVWDLVAEKGADGEGVPTGGTANQVLSKIDGTDFNTQWVTPTVTLTGDVTASGAWGGAATIAADSVTNAKLANMAASTIKARKTGSTGDPEDCTLTEVLDLVGSAAQGDILYRNATDWTRLGAGTSGHFLKTQGAGANPTWAAGSGALADGDYGDITVSSSGTVMTIDIVTAFTRTLLDDVDAAAARTTLGLGTSAVIDTGTSGTKVPLLDGANIWSMPQTFSNSLGIKIWDADVTHKLGILYSQLLTADRTLTLITGDADRSLTLTGNTTLSGTNTGDQTITLTGNVTGSGTGSFATTIAANAVADTMLRDSGACSVIGRSANSSGDPADISAASNDLILVRTSNALTFSTLTTILDFVGSAAQGDILYRGAASWTRLPASTSGLFLQTQGAGANPQWAAVTTPPSAASQADQETATSTTTYVSPGRQKYNPCAAKAWIVFDSTTGTPTISASYGVSSLTDNGTGDITVNFSTSFSTANYAASIGAGNGATGGFTFLLGPQTSDPTASAFRFRIFSDTGSTLVDRKWVSASFFGDQ